MSDARIAFFDDAAWEWDRDVPDFTQTPIFAEWWRTVSLRSGQVVLEIGCGTGRLLPLIWGCVNPGGAVYALDFSLRMLTRAKVRCDGTGIHFLCAAAHHLPLSSAMCDAVFLVSTFPHLRQRTRALQQIHRVLKPNGRLYLAHFDSRETINQRHRTIGGAVISDRIPTVKKTLELFTRCGFQSLSLDAKPDRFFLYASKKT
jgi:ubiquinone/menaquinone biosynthesis C-methylase UbiE